MVIENEPSSGNNHTMATREEPRKRRQPGRPPAGSEDKRARVLHEAVELFAHQGYAGTSLAEIARAAEISKAGLLHYFPSKDALFAAVLTQRDQKTHEEFLLDSTDAPWKLLDQWVHLIERNVQDPTGVALYSVMSGAAVSDEHPAHEWFTGHLATTIEMLTRAFDEGKKAGTVRPDAPSRSLARCLVALSDGLQVQWLAARACHDKDKTTVFGTDLVTETRMLAQAIRSTWGM